MPPRPDLLPGLAQAPPGSDAALARGWTWPEARRACDIHARGAFVDSWQFCQDVETLPAVRAAVRQLLASPCGLPWTTEGPDRAPGRFETEAAQAVWKKFRHRLLKPILRDLGLMGFTVLQHPITINPATLRHEITTIERFPLSAIRHTSYPLPDPWGPPGSYLYGYYAVIFGFGESIGDVLYPQLAAAREQLLGRAMAGDQSAGFAYGEIVAPPAGVNFRYIQLPRPGETSEDGRWTVLGNGDRPHETEGAIRALDVAYVAGTLAPRSRSGLLKTLGRQVPVASLPGTTPVDSPEGKAAEAVVAGMGVTAAGAVLPGGTTLTGFAFTTPTAHFYVDDAQLTERAVALAVLGRAGALGKTDAQYPSPVEAEVPEDLVRDLVGAVERGISALFNHVARRNNDALPEPIRVCGHMPDTEQVARRDAEGKAMLQVAAVLKAEGDAGCSVTQDRAAYLTRRLVAPDAQPPVVAAASPARILEWHVQQKIVSPDQALATLGLPELPNGAGSAERLAAERLAGKDSTGKPASQGDATVDTMPPTVDGPAGDDGAPPAPGDALALQVTPGNAPPTVDAPSTPASAGNTGA